MRPPKVDPKYAREIIRPASTPNSTGTQTDMHSKTEPRSATQSARTHAKSTNAPPPVQPQYAREFIRARSPQGATGKSDTKVSSTSIADISKLTGFEFEAYVVEQLIKSGLRVMYTKQTGDHGLDGVILGKKNKIGIQVKKQKSAITRPEMQKFIGALTTAKMKHGVYITTSNYTKTATLAASNFNIVLIDGADLERNAFMVGKLINPNW